MMETVQVLLSSYNGEKYIREQIDSILAQQGVQINLLVRDDGSTDGTRKILSEYEESHENITVLYGENIGVIKSFFALMEAAEKVIPYIAFSDQDDVWLPDKLARAVGLLKKKEEGQRGRRQQTKVPLVYCSAKQLVDADLHPLKQAISYPKVRTEFGNALVENMCTGCTCVINRDLLRLIQGRIPRFTVMHDFWIYLVGTCFGTVIYDEESKILYRQHERNVLGMASEKVENYKRRILRFKEYRGLLTKQALEFLRIYAGKMPKKNKGLAEDFVKSKNRVKLRKKIVLQKRVFRQRKSDNFILHVLLILGLV